MAINAPKGKLHGFSKTERLCNFALKNLLFENGEQFSEHPLRVYWKVIDTNLEKLFFEKNKTVFEGNTQKPNEIRVRQNPSYPLKKVPENALFHYPAKCLVGVSSKVHKSAVLRNKIKRLVKEAYRNNKQNFYSFLNESNVFCILGIIYTGKPIYTYREVEEKIIVSLHKLEKKISEYKHTCD